MTGDIALLTAGGPGIYEPPTLAPWQASIAGLTIGPGTPYEIARISGLDEMPELRTSDESRPWAHGMWDGDDWADGRTIPATIEIAAEPDISYDEALAAWRRIMVPTRTDNLVPFWVNIPHRAGGELLRWLVKVRRHRIPTDEQYEMGLATAELQLFASDPVGYGPQRQDSTGYPIPAGGLTFPLFTSSGAVDVGYLEFGLPGESAVITMDNPGTADTWATHMVDGPVLGGFEILDIPTGRRLRWTGDIPEGLALTIDTRTGTVLLDGVADRSNLLTVRQWAPVPVGGTSVVFLPLQNYTTAHLTSTWAPGWW